MINTPLKCFCCGSPILDPPAVQLLPGRDFCAWCQKVAIPVLAPIFLTEGTSEQLCNRVFFALISAQAKGEDLPSIIDHDDVEWFRQLAKTLVATFLPQAQQHKSLNHQ